MDRLFSNQTNYGDMDFESRRIKEEEQLRADLAREQLLGIATTPMSLSNINRFAPAEMVQSEYPIPNAEPYSTLTARQAPPSSDVGMMFSPEISRAAEMEYLQKRQGDMRARAMAFAQLSPMQQADYGFYRGGQQLGDALGGALGGQDPQLQKISARNAIMRRLDPSDPEQQMKIAQEVAPYDPEFAMSIADGARKSAIQIRQAQGANRQGVTAKIQVAERIATDEGLKVGTPEYKQRVAQLLQSPDNLSDAERKGARVAEITRLLNIGDGGIPFSLKERAALEAELATYERPDKQLSLTNDRDAVSAELFDNKPFAQITPAQKAIVNKRIEAEGQAKAKAGASSSEKQETEFSKDLGKADAKRVENAMTLRDTSIGALNSLNRLNQLNQQDLISGSFASNRVGVTNLLSTLGLANTRDIDRLSASENYQKTAGDVILATLGGKLGSGFSNADREFIQSLVPQLENSSQARKQLIEFMVKKNQEIVDETTRLENYARDNKSLKGYVPKIPVINVGSGSLTTLSDAELIEQAEKRGIKVRPK